jgi:TPR repeat protein
MRFTESWFLCSISTIFPQALSRCGEYDLQKIRTAAEKGTPESQFLLGKACFKGDDAPQDYSMAVELYRKAAEQGLAVA